MFYSTAEIARKHDREEEGGRGGKRKRWQRRKRIKDERKTESLPEIIN